MEIRDEVRQLISQALKIPIDQLKDDTNLEDLGADSLDVIEIIYELEKKFDISIAFKGGENKLVVRVEKDGVKSDQTFATIEEIARGVKLLVEAQAS